MKHIFLHQRNGRGIALYLQAYSFVTRTIGISPLEMRSTKERKPDCNKYVMDSLISFDCLEICSI